ncbi:MAG TPA: exonuclease subunit SbcD [Thermoleophilaceae bacterium]
MSLRILHTADWHLGDRLASQDRLPDQLARLNEIGAQLDEHAVDVLLVCGDVLEETRRGRLAEIFDALAQLLAPRIERGLQCVFLAGNHDSEHTFPLLTSVQTLLGPKAAARVRFVAEPSLVALEGADGDRAALVALPFPTSSRYHLDAGSFASVEDKQAALGDAVGEAIERLSAQADAELAGVPKVLAGHFLVADVAALTGARELAESEDVRLESLLLQRFAYVALGHVHLPTALDERMRYSGALERMDFGERDQERETLLVTLDGSGVGVTPLPLDATPLRQLEVGSLADLDEQAELLDQPQRTIVKLVLRLGPADSPSEWLAAARGRFPRLHDTPQIIRLDEPAPSLVTGGIDRLDVAGTLRGFLEAELAKDDPDRDDLLALAERLLAEQQEEPA